MGTGCVHEISFLSNAIAQTDPIDLNVVRPSSYKKRMRFELLGMGLSNLKFMLFLQLMQVLFI